MKKQDTLIKTIMSALFLALAFVIPFVTAQDMELGKMLCPMHIPVLLCGFICGWHWGLAVGFTAPLMRSFILGAPLLFPMAVTMAFELAAYGAVAGLCYKAFPKKRIYIYVALIIAMIIGRLVLGAANFICYGIKGESYLLNTFISGAFVTAVPGIIIQILLIPLLVIVFEKAAKSRSKV